MSHGPTVGVKQGWVPDVQSLIVDPHLGRLRTFVAVAEELSFSAAARRIFLTQQAVSLHIARLESDLGVRLFVRTTRSVALTPEGAALLPEARRLLKQADRFAMRVSSVGATKSNRVTVGYTFWIGHTIMPAIIARVRDDFFGIELLTRELYDSEIAPAVADGRLDIGIAFPPKRDEFLRTEVVRTEPLMLAVPHGHRVAEMTSVPLAHLDGETIYLWDRSFSAGYYDSVVSALQAANIDITIDTTDTGLNMWSKVAKGGGITFLPRGIQPNAGLRLVAIEEEMELQAAMTWRSDSTTPELEAVLATIRAVVRRL